MKESISRPKDVLNDMFQLGGGALGVKSKSNFPKSCQQVKYLRINKCPEDDTIKLIETCKNEMLNIEKAFIRSVDTYICYIKSTIDRFKHGFAQTLEISVLLMLALHIMLGQATLHLRHIGSYNF